MAPHHRHRRNNREELARLELPSSWALKPVGAAYSEGIVLVRCFYPSSSSPLHPPSPLPPPPCSFILFQPSTLLLSLLPPLLSRDGRDALTGLPWNVWDVVAQLRRVQAKHGDDTGGSNGGGVGVGGGCGRSGGGTGNAVLDPRQGDASQHMRYNCGCFLIEELVQCEHGAAKPVDYRVYVCGDAVLWVELTVHDAVLSTARQARSRPPPIRAPLAPHPHPTHPLSIHIPRWTPRTNPTSLRAAF